MKTVFIILTTATTQGLVTCHYPRNGVTFYPNTASNDIVQMYKTATTYKKILTPFIVHTELVRDSSVIRRHYIFLLEPSNVRAQYIRKTADLLLQLWVSTFPRFVAIGFYFLSETLI